MTTPAAELTWGVGAVAERTGVATSTLRTWERRYGLGPSHRTDGGHRRYTAADVERLEHMRRLLARGVTPREAAREAHELEAASLDALLAGEEPGDARLAPPEIVRAVVEACRDLDPARLSSLFGGALRRLGVRQAWESVLAPALVAIGDGWADGSIEVVAEHVASERLLSELRLLARAQMAQPPRRGSVVLTSAEDDQHSLPVYAVEAALAEQGVGCHVLGARVPWSGLVDVAHRLRPEAVFVWATLPRRDELPFAAAAAALPDDTRLVVGGPGWGDLDDVRLQRAADLDQAVALLVPRRG